MREKQVATNAKSADESFVMMPSIVVDRYKETAFRRLAAKHEVATLSIQPYSFLTMELRNRYACIDCEAVPAMRRRQGSGVRTRGYERESELR